MEMPESKYFEYKNFIVSDKRIIKNLTIAYRTWGKLNQGKDNAVLICHGYTNHHHALDEDIGWFNNLMGPGKALDTNKYFVICSNMLGSSFGTTGPKSIYDKTNKPYGSNFPKIINLDIINAQKHLVESLKIKKLHAALGYSFGGHLVYLWATEFPDSLCKIVSIAGSLDRWDVTKEKIELIEKPFSDCKNWNKGNFYELDDTEIKKALINYRINVLNHYGFGEYLKTQYNDQKDINAIIETSAKGWADHFDPNSLTILRRANYKSSAFKKAFKIKVPVLKILAKTDKVTNMKKGYETIEYLKSLNITCSLVELETKFGHYGPMVDSLEWSARLKNFIEDNII